LQVMSQLLGTFMPKVRTTMGWGGRSHSHSSESPESQGTDTSERLCADHHFEMTGYLRKRNTKAKSKMLRKWDKRWFAVDKGALVYAASAKETEARRSFPITDILEVRVVEDPEKKGQQFEFEVTLPGRVLRLRPKSDSQRRHWVAAIQRVRALARGMVTDGQPDSTSVAGGRGRCTLYMPYRVESIRLLCPPPRPL